LLCEFAISSNCESERIQKIAKRKRSEVQSILCEANSLRFAIFRNRANSHCEFGALLALILPKNLNDSLTGTQLLITLLLHETASFYFYI
jgi:hypothetical protein